MYIWAKENPDFKYQQGMNDILAIVLVAVMSDCLTREIPSQYESETDYERLIETIVESASSKKKRHF